MAETSDVFLKNIIKTVGDLKIGYEVKNSDGSTRSQGEIAKEEQEMIPAFDMDSSIIITVPSEFSDKKWYVTVWSDVDTAVTYGKGNLECTVSIAPNSQTSNVPNEMNVSVGSEEPT